MALQPHAKAVLTFLSTEEGGRQKMIPEDALKNYRYRPHIVIGDPLHRELRPEVLEKAQLFCEGDGAYLGVAFNDVSGQPESGEEVVAEFAFMYYPNVSYIEAVVGATFTLREGASVVAYGRIIEIEKKETIRKDPVDRL